MTKSNISTLSLASAMLAITFGHSFEWWCNNDPLASAKYVDSRNVWTLACRKINKHHTSVNPDPRPLPPAPAAPMPTTPRPNVVKMARVARLNSLGISNERVYQKIA